MGETHKAIAERLGLDLQLSDAADHTARFGPKRWPSTRSDALSVTALCVSPPERRRRASRRR